MPSPRRPRWLVWAAQFGRRVGLREGQLGQVANGRDETARRGGACRGVRGALPRLCPLQVTTAPSSNRARRSPDVTEPGCNAVATYVVV